MGYDTFIRLFDPKYYSEDNSLETFVEKIKRKNIHFHVAGRYSQTSGIYNKLDLEELNSDYVPKLIAENIHPITLSDGSDFRVDISSTELRKRAAMKKPE